MTSWGHRGREINLVGGVKGSNWRLPGEDTKLMTRSSSGSKGNVPGREDSANKGMNVESEKMF